jgi:hypothetical protein
MAATCRSGKQHYARRFDPAGRVSCCGLCMNSTFRFPIPQDEATPQDSLFAKRFGDEENQDCSADAATQNQIKQ